MADFEPAVPRSFSTRVREHTMAWHQSAEDSGFLRRVATGDADRAECLAMAVQHLAVYRCLDGCADALRHLDQRGAPFTAHAGLARTPRIEADLDALSADEGEILAATRAYVDRITLVGQTSYGLVAHHYTRYLGDLSGGFVIGRGFAKSLGLAVGDPGTSFYSFDTVEDPNTFKQGYRKALDDNEWTADEQDAFLDEVVVAYEHNQAMYAALADLRGSRSLVR